MQRFNSVLINWEAILSCQGSLDYPPRKVGLAGGVIGRELRKTDFQVTSPHYLVLTHWTTMLHCKLWVSEVSLSFGAEIPTSAAVSDDAAGTGTLKN